MKLNQARIALSAIAIFAIVGGAVAVKANKATKRGAIVWTTNALGAAAINPADDRTIGAGGQLTFGSTVFNDTAVEIRTVVQQ